MKTIATVVASLLLSLGLLVSPASAEEVPPTSCDETIQAWKGRALAAEARAELMSADLYFAQAAKRTLEDRVMVLLARVEFTESRLSDAQAKVAQQQEQFYRQFNKIGRQQATIDRLRDRLYAARNR